MSSKTVAIIGAGPGGLVAAKTLLDSHPKNTFQVTIFEKSDRIGGIWIVTLDRPDGIIPASMPTNLSQFAVSFSDLAWSSLDLPGGKIHMHPKAWQVNRYLEEYRRRYIPNDVVKLKTEVRALEEESTSGWKITHATAGSTQEESEHFDFCILASGFYAKALPIRVELDGFSESISPVKIIHSSRYRSLKDILPYGSNSGKKLLVVGGANSGGEVAAALAFDLSNATHAPGGQSMDYEIVHILPKPIYGLPLFVPAADDTDAFIPLDIRFYDLSKRLDQPISLKFGRHTDDSKRMLHGLIQGMLGTDLYENGLQKPLNEHEGDLPVPKAAIQDNWASYVRSGNIQIEAGRVLALHSHGPNKPLTATVKSSAGAGKMITLDDIAGVIYATGYTPEPALRILPERIKQALSYDANCYRLPILLPEDTLASHPAIPNLGFIGIYEGPYWGVMEMQARKLAARWASSPSPPSNTTRPQIVLSDRAKIHLDSLLDMRSALKEAPHIVPQYIFSDYLAIMEESARDLNLTRNDGPWAADQGPITPSRYLDSGSDTTEANKTISSLQHIIHESKTKGRFVPRVVFRGLQGRWKMHRNLESKRPEYPTGVFTGEAWFHPRLATASSALPSNGTTAGAVSFDQEYLYCENGTLNTTSGLVMPTYKNYVWRFSEGTGGSESAGLTGDSGEKISVWFVKQDDSKSVDYLYHYLDFIIDAGSQSSNKTVGEDDDAGNDSGKFTVRAKSDHLCEKDMYITEYSFVFNGVAVQAV